MGWVMRSSSTSYGFASKKDPRFKGEGQCSGVFVARDIINKEILELEKKLGVEAPDDIEIWAMKD